MQVIAEQQTAAWLWPAEILQALLQTSTEDSWRQERYWQIPKFYHCFVFQNDKWYEQRQDLKKCFSVSLLIPPNPPSLRPLLMAFMRLLETDVFITKTDLSKTPQQERHRWTQKSWGKGSAVWEVQDRSWMETAQGCVFRAINVRPGLEAQKNEVSNTRADWLRHMNTSGMWCIFSDWTDSPREWCGFD